jgi:hypothetical protein
MSRAIIYEINTQEDINLLEWMITNKANKYPQGTVQVK